MTQLSRPFQIVLVVFGLFAAVWFFALRGHSTSTGGAGSSASSPASSASSSSAPSPAAQPAAPSTPYHGSAPGIAGLTRAIEKAHGAVTQSEQNAKQLQNKSAKASGEASSGTAPSTSQAGAQAAHAVTPKTAATVPRTAATVPKRAATVPKTAATVPKRAATVPKSVATVPRSASTATGARGAGQSKVGAAPRMQVTVEGALKHGKLVTVLFWNPKGTVDQVVHSELQAVGRASGGKIAVFVATARQVGSFGSFTKAVQVNATPTILIVNSRGQASTLTGLTDVFSIDQTIGEAKK